MINCGYSENFLIIMKYWEVSKVFIFLIFIKNVRKAPEICGCG